MTCTAPGGSHVVYAPMSSPLAAWHFCPPASVRGWDSPGGSCELLGVNSWTPSCCCSASGYRLCLGCLWLVQSSLVCPDPLRTSLVYLQYTKAGWCPSSCIPLFGLFYSKNKYLPLLFVRNLAINPHTHDVAVIMKPGIFGNRLALSRS